MRPDDRLLSPGLLEAPVGSLLARLADSVSVGVAGVGGVAGVATMGGVEIRCGAATAATAGTGAAEGAGDAGVVGACTAGEDDASDARELAGTCAGGRGCGVLRCGDTLGAAWAVAARRGRFGSAEVRDVSSAASASTPAADGAAGCAAGVGDGTDAGGRTGTGAVYVDGEEEPARPRTATPALLVERRLLPGAGDGAAVAGTVAGVVADCCSPGVVPGLKSVSCESHERITKEGYHALGLASKRVRASKPLREFLTLSSSAGCAEGGAAAVAGVAGVTSVAAPPVTAGAADGATVLGAAAGTLPVTELRLEGERGLTCCGPCTTAETVTTCALGTAACERRRLPKSALGAPPPRGESGAGAAASACVVAAGFWGDAASPAAGAAGLAASFGAAAAAASRGIAGAGAALGITSGLSGRGLAIAAPTAGEDCARGRASPGAAGRAIAGPAMLERDEVTTAVGVGELPLDARDEVDRGEGSAARRSARSRISTLAAVRSMGRSCVPFSSLTKPTLAMGDCVGSRTLVGLRRTTRRPTNLGCFSRNAMRAAPVVGLSAG